MTQAAVQSKPDLVQMVKDDPMSILRIPRREHFELLLAIREDYIGLEVCTTPNYWPDRIDFTHAMPSGSGIYQCNSGEDDCPYMTKDEEGPVFCAYKSEMQL